MMTQFSNTQPAVSASAIKINGDEIHTPDGYLIDQFLQSKTNKRTDIYGGTVEKRFRFPFHRQSTAAGLPHGPEILS